MISGPRRVRADRYPPATAGAGGEVESVGGILDEMNQKRAVARRDDVPFAQQHPPHAQAVDLGPVGAAQIDQMAEGGSLLIWKCSLESAWS